jgi:hypothetical protein
MDLVSYEKFYLGNEPGTFVCVVTESSMVK